VVKPIAGASDSQAEEESVVDHDEVATPINLFDYLL
jgi:hypothetical protein